MKLLHSYLLATLLIVFYSCTRPVEDIQADPQLQVDKVDLILRAEAGSLDSFSVRSNIDWKVSPSTASWFKLDVLNATAGRKIIATAVEKNTTGSPRVATFTITPVDKPAVQPVTVTITQLATTINAQLSLSDTLIVLNGQMDAQDSFTIQSNISWAVSSPYNVLDFTPTIGSGNRTVTIRARSGSWEDLWKKAPITVTVSPVGDSTVQPVTLTVKMQNRSIATMWNKVYGGYEDDNLVAITKTPDGGFVVAGTTNGNSGDVSGHHGYRDAWVVKVDASGNKVWQKSLGGYYNDEANAVVTTSDGGFVIAGYTDSDDGDVAGRHGSSDAWVVKLDASGNKVWQRTLGGTQHDAARSVVATADGGVVVAGGTSSKDGDVSTSLGKGDAWVVKLDAGGNKVWEKSLGGPDGDNAEAIAQAPNGDFFLTVTTYTADWIVSYIYRLDRNGNQLWKQMVVQGMLDRVSPSVAVTKDGGCITVNNFNTGLTYTKFSSEGKWLWERPLATTSPHATQIIPLKDGGFIASGLTKMTGASVYNARIFKINEDGDLQWSKQFGGVEDDFLYGIVEAEPGSYVAVGTSDSNDGDFAGQHGVATDGWIIKIKD